MATLRKCSAVKLGVKKATMEAAANNEAGRTIQYSKEDASGDSQRQGKGKGNRQNAQHHQIRSKRGIADQVQKSPWNPLQDEPRRSRYNQCGVASNMARASFSADSAPRYKFVDLFRGTLTCGTA
uniref:Uncharacterized protein n=1 Tax=Ditylenchus dipsaci TaxID=166011 RepID=A0A915CVG2_9BILA